MGLEATIPENREQAVLELAEELGLTRSQLIDEALGLFLKAVREVQRGRRVVTVSASQPSANEPLCDLATPTLEALEWVSNPERINLSAAEFTKLQDLVSSPPAATAHLRAAVKRHAR